MRLNLTDFHQFSSKMASFQIRSAPQFHQFSRNFVGNCQFSHTECAPISPIFVENCSFSNKEFRQKWSNFKKGARGAVSVVSVADSLFRPHPEQRARASREPICSKCSKTVQNMFKYVQFSNKECASISLIFTNFRRNLQVFK